MTKIRETDRAAGLADTVGDLAPVFTLANELSGGHYAGEKLAPVLLRLLGELRTARRGIALQRASDGAIRSAISIESPYEHTTHLPGCTGCAICSPP